MKLQHVGAWKWDLHYVYPKITWKVVSLYRTYSYTNAIKEIPLITVEYSSIQRAVPCSQHNGGKETKLNLVSESRESPLSHFLCSISSHITYLVHEFCTHSPMQLQILLLCLKLKSMIHPHLRTIIP